MTGQSTAINADDQLLASILLGHEAAADKSAYEAEQYALHPAMKRELQSLFEMHRVGCDAHPTPPLAPRRLTDGARLGPFRIERFLAAGGMGEVYEAWHERLRRKVALKVIRSGHTSPSARDRFLREQRVLARLHQTHIVPIYESAEEDDLEYFAMPHIDGVALHSVVRSAYARETSKAGGSTPSLPELVASIVDGPAVNPTAHQPSAAPPTTPLADTAAPPSDKLQLSMAYCRSVATVMAQAAEAVQAAHNVGICHRDLKPSNLMVGRKGECWIIDFGLAGYLDRPGEPIPVGEAAREADGLNTGGPLGTPAYMAPEQYAGKPDRCSDVWSLGATLYELLTLRPAFSGPYPTVRERIKSAEPTPPRELVANLPADLAAICLKALRKDPADRYATAQAIADDLTRWLSFMPTVARPAHTLRRVALWARRNKGWATAIVAAVTCGTLAILAANARAQVAEGRARASERQISLGKLQQLRMSAHSNGWSRDAWTQVTQLARDDNSLDLRNQAAATLAGLDAHAEKQFANLGASSVAYDATGQRLLIGGVTELPDHKRPAEGAKVWDRQKDKMVHVSSRTGDGPVAFRADGTPLQLVANPQDRHALVLWDVADDKLVREVRNPSAPPPEPLTPDNGPEMVLSSDGATVAAAFPRPDETATVAVWDAASGEVVYQTTDKAMSLAVSPDRTLLAPGDVDGRIVIRTLPKGDVLATLKADRAAVTCLALHRDPRRVAGPSGPTTGWLLGAGDESGTITVWDCVARVPRCVCRGSSYRVTSVSFSPDGVTLASTAQGAVKLWDVASGRSLVEVRRYNEVTGAAFSPDGNLLASSLVAAHGSPGHVEISQLEADRGIRTLRGLAGCVEKVVYSPDERLMAALSQDHRIAVWDLKTGSLRHIFDAPRGAWVDNAAFAISGDNRSLAFAGSTNTRGRAVVWDLDTGKEAASRSFSPGMNNVLAFHPSGKLLLFQVETKNAQRIPGGANIRSENPLVLRVRDLRGDPSKPLYELTSFNRYIDFLRASEDGSVAVLVGYSGDDQVKSRRIVAFDGLTGRELWSSQAETLDPKKGRIYLTLDRSGRHLTVCQVEPGPVSTTLIELPTGKHLGMGNPVPHDGQYWAPHMPYGIDASGARYPAYPAGHLAVLRRGQPDAVVILAIDVPSHGVQKAFNASGTQFAWGRVDGSVGIADFPEIRRRLTAVGLGW